ncbi:universal stress protein [Halococcus salifodinae]|uniref:UspA domain-containing protein n=1 Tax=Halococcus salifodinae DSM 8989 TaxID=1227456 RepID=M0MQY0_9EURY|nr:universal stress protein [Halococcus salifodinae]EMA48127.1 UspA domain-containing protein [Halococcus salifodinae DSM 8989]
MYEHVLLPTDGSEAAANAANEAFGVATNNTATLHILSIVDITSGPLNVRGGDERFDQAEADGEEIVTETMEQAKQSGVENVITSVKRGTPDEMIRDYAGDNDIDLIIMGTHGRSGLDRHLIGSVTEKVVRQAKPSVLTVRMADDEE